MGGPGVRLQDATVCVCGVDPTPTMVEVASCRRGVASRSGRADLRMGSDSPLPWPDGCFAGAASLHSFQFWPDPAASVGELRRVIRPGGRLVLILRDHSSRAPAWLPNPSSRGGREVEAAAELLERASFTVRREPPVGSSAVLFASRSDRAG
jgi:SAM-dependent methyltransferase